VRRHSPAPLALVLTAEEAINAAIRVAGKAVNTAIGFTLL
jgi:hypothetical protein